MLSRGLSLVAGAALLSGAVAVASPSVPGNGPASARPSGDAISLHASIAPGITPGTSRLVRLSASNEAADAVAVTNVRLVGISADEAHATCVTGDFTMADVAQKTTLPGESRDRRLASGRLAYRNTGVSQDACKGATLTLRLSSR